MQRFYTKLRSSLRVATLGDGLYQKIRLLLLLYWLPIRRRLGRPDLPLVFSLFKNGQPFTVHLSGSHEELLILDEILARDEYAIPLHEARVIFDIGGNVGFAALFFSLMYPTAQVHTFEPSPYTYKRLVVNVSQRSQIKPHNIALTAHDGPIAIYENKEKPIATSVKNRGDKFERMMVEGYSLASTVENVGIEFVDVLKFDVEGAEYDMFREFKEFDRVRYVVGEVHEDLMSASIDDFLALLLPFFDLHVTPASKSGRYIVKGFNRKNVPQV